MNGKTIFAAIAGAITGFLSGGLIYALLLSGYMKDNTITYTGLMKEPMVLWAIFGSNLGCGILYTWIFRSASVNKWMDGIIKGGIIGLLTSLSFDFFIYASMNVYKNTGVIIVDVLASTIIGTLMGAVIAIILGFEKKSK